jgi:hypothetical protein
LITANRLSFPWAMESPLQWQATITAPVLLIPLLAGLPPPGDGTAILPSYPLDVALVTREPTCSAAGPPPVYAVARGPKGVEFTAVSVQTATAQSPSVKESSSSSRLRITGLSANGLPWEFPLPAVTGCSSQGNGVRHEHSLCVVPCGTIMQSGKLLPFATNINHKVEEQLPPGEGSAAAVGRESFSTLTLDLEGPQSLSLILPADLVRRILDVVHL